MLGFIIDEDLTQAELEFPGICALYASLDDKPTTFLELVWLYQEHMQGIQRRLVLGQDDASGMAHYQEAQMGAH
ncbi:MAG: hypothetical protein MJE77_08340 [Proteobacteria bacterium]|nr:hypothetical protein [Pseudomonadota bacterium]